MKITDKRCISALERRTGWYEPYTSPLAGKRLGGSEQPQTEFVAAEGEGCSNHQTQDMVKIW